MEVEQIKRLEDASKKMASQIDIDYLRKMQANMHRCAARCCDDSSSSIDSLQSCVDNCSRTLNEAQRFVETEFSSSQNRLQRCILECNDNIKDKMGASPSESETKKFTAEFETCAVKCVDKHVENLPIMFKRIQEVLRKKKEQSALYYPN